MKVLVAPNSLKNAANAFDIAAAIGKGLRKAIPDIELVEMPVADGGEFTLEILLEALKGKIILSETLDPIGREIDAIYGITEDQTAIIELAKASGTELLFSTEKRPLMTSTFGTGLQIKDALERGCRKFILTLGGSATVDGGAGILQALGIELLDKHGNTLPRGGGNLIILDSFRTSTILKSLEEAEFTLLCDVANPLLGERGAAMMFSAQKGANYLESMLLERCMVNFGEQCEMQSGKKLIKLKGAGAAGGVPVGLSTFMNIRSVSGIEYVMNLLGTEEAIRQADVVITAEGSLDDQTFIGKGPSVIATKARAAGKKVICIAGEVPLRFRNPDKTFDAVFSLQNKPMSLSESIDNTLENIKNTAFEIGRLLD